MTYASGGGVIPPRDDDSIPAFLTSGYVIPNSVLRQLGAGQLDALMHAYIDSDL